MCVVWCVCAYPCVSVRKPHKARVCTCLCAYLCALSSPRLSLRCCKITTPLVACNVNVTRIQGAELALTLDEVGDIPGNLEGLSLKAMKQHLSARGVDYTGFQGA